MHGCWSPGCLILVGEFIVTTFPLKDLATGSYRTGLCGPLRFRSEMAWRVPLTLCDLNPQPVVRQSRPAALSGGMQKNLLHKKSGRCRMSSFISLVYLASGARIRNVWEGQNGVEILISVPLDGKPFLHHFGQPEFTTGASNCKWRLFLQSYYRYRGTHVCETRASTALLFPVVLPTHGSHPPMQPTARRTSSWSILRSCSNVTL